MLRSLTRWLESKRRPKNWQTARDQYRKYHDSCAFCNIGKSLEVHDKLPFHCIMNPESWSVADWTGNFIVLCTHDHRMQAHCGDPNCLDFNPAIETLAGVVTESRVEQCTRC